MRVATRVVLGLAMLAMLAFVPAQTQEPSAAETRLFIAPIANPELGDGPRRYEYLERLMDAPECSGIVPVSRAGIADFEVWFEFEFEFGARHYMTLWDASGRWVAGDEAGGSEEIVAAVCDTIARKLAG